MRGYEYAPGHYVIMEAEGLEQLRPARDHVLIVEQFVPVGNIDPLFFAGRSLYLLPDAGGPRGLGPGGMAMSRTRAAKDLAIGDIIQVDILEDDQVVRKAQPICKGLDAGLLHLTLVAPDGDVERIALAPEERVTFVGKAPEAGKSQGASPGKA